MVFRPPRDRPRQRLASASSYFPGPTPATNFGQIDRDRVRVEARPDRVGRVSPPAFPRHPSYTSDQTAARRCSISQTVPAGPATGSPSSRQTGPHPRTNGCPDSTGITGLARKQSLDPFPLCVCQAMASGHRGSSLTDPVDENQTISIPAVPATRNVHTAWRDRAAFTDREFRPRADCGRADRSSGRVPAG